MGPILSTRPDLLPVDFVQEFAKLQEDVSAFPLCDVKRIVEEELQEPLEQIFPYFEEQPLAATYTSPPGSCVSLPERFSGSSTTTSKSFPLDIMFA